MKKYLQFQHSLATAKDLTALNMQVLLYSRKNSNRLLL